MVTDENARDQVYSTVLQYWLRKDRAAATTWIQQAPELTPGRRDQLLAIPAQPGGSGE